MEDRAQGRRTRRRRRRTFAVIAVVGACVIVAAIAAVALVGDDDPRADPSASSTRAPAEASTPASSTTTTVPPATTTTFAPGKSPLAVDRRYAVGVHDVTYTDTTRSTSANGSFGGAPSRTLPTTIWYPAVGDPARAAEHDVPPDTDHGRYPLVLFAHGYAVTPDFYRPMLERWASAGYVVAAPTFPILSGTPGGASHTDYEKTFADASFVITRILATAGSDAVVALVDPDRIAAAGHSDGEVVAFAIGFLSCCRDPRVDAVIPMAGDLRNAQNPHVRDTGTPILHVMETNDEYDPYGPSIEWDRENLTAPRFLLTLVGASHVPPYTRPGDPHFELTMTVTVDFLDGTLKGHPELLDRMATDVASRGGLASLER